MESLNHCKEKTLAKASLKYVHMLLASKLNSADRRLIVKTQKCMRCTTVPKKDMESKKNWSPS